MDTLPLLSLYCGAILLASLAGGLLPLVLRGSHTRLQLYLSFASGTMLGAAFFHMLPDAAEGGARGALAWSLAGLLILFFLERYFAFHHHEIGGGECGERDAALPVIEHGGGGHAHPPTSPLAWGAAAIGLSVHTLTTGFALASAVATSEEGGWGLGVFLAVLFHKPADSLTIVSLMLASGASKRGAHTVNALFACLVPVGAVLYAAGSAAVGVGFARGALAFSAGTFLCVALGDLLPELQFHRHDRGKLSLALLAGVALMWATVGLEAGR